MERAKVRNLNENQQDRQAVTVHQVEGKCQIYVYTYCKLTFMFYVPTRVTRRKGNQKIYIPFNALINFFTFLKEVQQ